MRPLSHLIRVQRKCTRWGSSLVKLPLPDLDVTLDRYKLSVKPFLSPAERTVTDELVRNFDDCDGRKLQEKLSDKVDACDSWLSDFLTKANLKKNAPLVIYSNAAAVFPTRKFEDKKDQIKVASMVTEAVLDFKNVVERGGPEEGEPLCKAQFKKLFGTYRAPGKTEDDLYLNPKSEHFVVAYKNVFYKFPINNFTSFQMAKALDEVMRETKCPGPPLGMLTALPRPVWFEAHGELVKIAPMNKKSLEDIRMSLFLVCIDETVPTDPDSNARVQLQQNLAHILHGGGSKVNSANRWFDKTIQIIVGKGGSVGINFERSAIEGEVILKMMDHIERFLGQNKELKVDTGKGHIEKTPLCFQLNRKIEKAMSMASLGLSQSSEKLLIHTFILNAFGEKDILKLGVCPTAFLQVAIQFAFYKIHNKVGAHDETVSTRKFVQGRTETVRACTQEVTEFICKSSKPEVSAECKRSLLTKAIDRHVQLETEASRGEGVDRHMFALKFLGEQEGFGSPDLFKDIGWTHSTKFRIKTIQVKSSCGGILVYGPVVPNDYTCSYSIAPRCIFMCVTAWKPLGSDPIKLQKKLTEAMKEMRTLLELSTSSSKN